jgi:hypothetical protein
MATRRIAIILAAAALCVGSASPASATTAKVRPVSDAQLLRFAATKFDPRKMMFHREIIGLHRGALVVADYPCGDVCPAYTRRIIHYDVKAADCARTGGAIVSELVPRGPAVAKRDFCEPAVLAGRSRR